MADWAFGIVPAKELEGAGRGAFFELCTLVSQITGVSFRPMIASSHRELATSMDEEEEVGLAWLPPIPTIELEAAGRATVLAIPSRQGVTTYHSALIVRRGGPRSIAELRGRRAAWVQRDSAAGYLVPRMHLAASGIDVMHFFAREAFVQNHLAVVEAVVHGEADVGATYCHVEPGPRPDVPPKVVRGPWLDIDGRADRPVDVLATFGPIPNDALVASNELPAMARSALTRWLLAPPARARELFMALLGASELRVPGPGHFDALRHMARAARARGQDSVPPSSRSGLLAARRRP